MKLTAQHTHAAPRPQCWLSAALGMQKVGAFPGTNPNPSRQCRSRGKQGAGPDRPMHCALPPYQGQRSSGMSKYSA